MQISLFRSIISNWANLICVVVVGLVVPPIIIAGLGKADYGLLTLLTSITAQLILFDLGVRSSIVRHVASLRDKIRSPKAALHDIENYRLQMGAASTLLFCSIAISIFLVLIIIPNLGAWFQIDQEHLKIAQFLLALLTIDAVLDLAFGPCNATLAALERYDILNGLNILRLLSYGVLVALAINYNFGLFGVVLVILITKLVFRFSLLYFSKRYIPHFTIFPKATNYKEIRRVGIYSFWAFLIALSTRTIYQVDSIVIGIFSGTSPVAVYGVAVLLAEQLRMFAQSGSTILTPRISALLANNDTSTSETLVLKWCKYSQLLNLLITLPLIVMGPVFIRLWVGEGFEESSYILRILLVSFFFTLPALGLTNRLLADDKHNLAAKLLLIEAILNLGLSIVLIQSNGIEGVAIGTVIPAILISGILLPYFTVQTTNISRFSYITETFLRPLPFFVAYLVSLHFVRLNIPIDSWGYFISSNCLTGVAMSVVLYFLYIGREDRAYLHRRIRLVGRTEAGPNRT